MAVSEKVAQNNNSKKTISDELKAKLSVVQSGISGSKQEFKESINNFDVDDKSKNISDDLIELRESFKRIDNKENTLTLNEKLNNNLNYVEAELKSILSDLEVALGRVPDGVGFSQELIDAKESVELKLHKIMINNIPRVEVLKLVSDARKGVKVKPEYKREKWGNVLNYLEDQYGEYLSRFNDEKVDYIYLNEIRQIDLNYYTALFKYLKRNNHQIEDFIPTNKTRLDKKAAKVTEREMRIFRKIKNLKETGRI